MSNLYNFSQNGVGSFLQYGLGGGKLHWDNGFKITTSSNVLTPIQIGEPIITTHATTKGYVDSLFNSVTNRLDSSFKTAVKGIWPDPIADLTTFVGGTTALADGAIQYDVGDRILLTHQSDPKENGIYNITTNGLVRTDDCDTSDKMANAFVYASRGNLEGGKFYLTDFKKYHVLDSNPVEFNEYVSPSLPAGVGINQDNNAYNLDIMELPEVANMTKANEYIAFSSALDNSVRRITLDKVIRDYEVLTCQNVMAKIKLNIDGEAGPLKWTCVNNIPRLEFDIMSLTPRANISTTASHVIVHDGIKNVRVTVSELLSSAGVSGTSLQPFAGLGIGWSNTDGYNLAVNELPTTSTINTSSSYVPIFDGSTHKKVTLQTLLANTSVNGTALSPYAGNGIGWTNNKYELAIQEMPVVTTATPSNTYIGISDTTNTNKRMTLSSLFALNTTVNPAALTPYAGDGITWGSGQYNLDVNDLSPVNAIPSTGLIAVHDGTSTKKITIQNFINSNNLGVSASSLQPFAGLGVYWNNTLNAYEMGVQELQLVTATPAASSYIPFYDGTTHKRISVADLITAQSSVSPSALQPYAGLGIGWDSNKYSLDIGELPAASTIDRSTTFIAVDDGTSHRKIKISDALNGYTPSLANSAGEGLSYDTSTSKIELDLGSLTNSSVINFGSGNTYFAMVDSAGVQRTFSSNLMQGQLGYIKANNIPSLVDVKNAGGLKREVDTNNKVTLELDYSNLSPLPSGDTIDYVNDKLSFYDTSTTSNRSIAVGKLAFPPLSALPSYGTNTIDVSNDLIEVYDVDANVPRKVPLQNVLSLGSSTPTYSSGGSASTPAIVATSADAAANGPTGIYFGDDATRPDNNKFGFVYHGTKIFDTDGQVINLNNHVDGGQAIIFNRKDTLNLSTNFTLAPYSSTLFSLGGYIKSDINGSLNDYYMGGMKMVLGKTSTSIKSAISFDVGTIGSTQSPFMITTDGVRTSGTGGVTNPQLTIRHTAYQNNIGLYVEQVGTNSTRRAGLSLTTDLQNRKMHFGPYELSHDAGYDLRLNDNAIIFDASHDEGELRSTYGTLDHIWFNQTDGSLNVVNNGIYKSAGNGKIVAAATAANHADLAEKYEADAPYEAGTVVVIGGTKEVTISNKVNDRSVAGIVSTEPAFMMNNKPENKDWPYVALAGRVPCKVYGDIKKGDVLVSGLNGHATVDNDAFFGVIGIALEDYKGESGVIEVMVKSG